MLSLKCWTGRKIKYGHPLRLDLRLGGRIKLSWLKHYRRVAYTGQQLAIEANAGATAMMDLGHFTFMLSPRRKKRLSVCRNSGDIAWN